MAYQSVLSTISLESAADLTAKQYFFVKVDTAGKAALCGDGENAIGVLQNDPNTGQAAAIAIDGVSKVVAAAAITTGAAVASNADGKAVTAASGEFILGIALETGADGRTISIALNKNGKV
jgi:hypothetical protein